MTSHKPSVLLACYADCTAGLMIASVLRLRDAELPVEVCHLSDIQSCSPELEALLSEMGAELPTISPASSLAGRHFDYAIALSRLADKQLKSFPVTFDHHWLIHYGDASGLGEGVERMEALRRLRDDIRTGFLSFYRSQVEGISDCQG